MDFKITVSCILNILSFHGPIQLGTSPELVSWRCFGCFTPTPAPRRARNAFVPAPDLSPVVSDFPVLKSKRTENAPVCAHTLVHYNIFGDWPWSGGIISVLSLRRDNGSDPVLPADPKSEDGLNLDMEAMLKFHIWPNGLIPYHIDDFSFDKVLRDRIRMYLNEVNRITTLRFEEIPRPPEDDDTRWVLFLNRRGLLRCEENYFGDFTNDGVQTVVLGYDCMNSDENLAAMVLSLVGVPAQHNAPDRDEYVDILKENILPNKLIFFEKLNETEWLFHNLRYDYDSAGHYGPYKYTSNGNVTVQRKQRDFYFFNNLGPPPPKSKEKGFSTQDVLKIAMLYNYIARKPEIPVPECGILYGAGTKKVRLSHYTNFNMKYTEKPIQGKANLEKSAKKLVYPENQNSIEYYNYESEYSENNDEDDNENEYKDSNYPEEDYSGNYMEQSEDDEEEEEDYVNSNFEDDDDNDDDDNDDDDHEGYGNIDNNYGYYINKFKAGKGKKNAKIYASSKNYTKLKGKLTDGNKKSSPVDSKSDDTENQKKPSENSNEYNSTKIINTYGTVKSTRKYDRMPLHLKLKKKSNKQSLLGQSDFETDDDYKNMYIHEKKL